MSPKYYKKFTKNYLNWVGKVDFKKWGKRFLAKKTFFKCKIFEERLCFPKKEAILTKHAKHPILKNTLVYKLEIISATTLMP